MCFLYGEMGEDGVWVVVLGFHILYGARISVPVYVGYFDFFFQTIFFLNYTFKSLAPFSVL